MLLGPCATVISFGLYRTANTDVGRILLAGSTAIALGLSCAQWRMAAVSAPVLEKRIGPVRMTGTIEHIEPSPSGARIIMTGVVIPRLAASAVPARIRLSIRGDQARIVRLLPGDRIKVAAVLRPPPPPTMPGAFDFQRHAYFLGIGAYGFVLGKIEKTGGDARAPPQSRRILRAVERLRLRMTTNIYQRQSDDSGAVAAALLTGNRGYIDERVLEIMRDAGIAHLLAISGLHIGLVAGIVFAFVRILVAAFPWAGLRVNGKKVAASAAIPAAFAYAVLAGFTVPTERAFLMTGLMLGGILLDRRALSLRNVAWAAAVILIFRPESLIGPGFQMSFAAVTALISVYAVLGVRRAKKGQRHASGILHASLRYIAGVLLSTLVASAATAPFAIYHFQHAAAFGLIANAVAVPIAAFWVMPAGIATFAAMPLGLEAVPLELMCTGIDVILSCAGFLADLPEAAVDFAAPPGWCLGLVTFAGLWLTLWRQRWRLAAIPFLAVGLLGPAFTATPDIIVDGSGRLIAVQNGNTAFLTSNGRAARFEAEDWRQRTGTATSSTWRADAETVQGRLRCDHHGCTMDLGQRLIAISMDAATIADDCRRSSMIVATVPVRGNCRLPWGIIDRFDLWRYGTHTVTFTDAGPVVKTVNGERGRRPWVSWPD
ncbi:MAG: ComEC/Rec2 family competence protein [Rhodospirillales bacterium]|nr:ComEC/Rec2 family competence protein [Rhodospirillales bacterium]